MSVLTHHEISSKKDSLYDRLEKQGVIHEGKTYSLRRKEYVDTVVLDYGKCDPTYAKRAQELFTIEKTQYEKQLRGDKDLRPEEVHDMLVEYDKLNPLFCPVFRSKGGNVAWVLNYGINDMPAEAISKQYPEETMDYFTSTEGNVSSCKVRGGDALKNDIIFVHPKATQVERGENGRNTGVTVWGYRDPGGKYYGVEIPNGLKTDDVYYNIARKSEKWKNYVVVVMKPEAMLKAVAKDGSEILLSAKEFGNFVKNRNRKLENPMVLNKTSKKKKVNGNELGK